MTYETILHWEERNKKDYPDWAVVFHYDAYGECWEIKPWGNLKDFYTEERKSDAGNAIWDVRFEPIVALPELEIPKWGDGVLLIRHSTKV